MGKDVIVALDFPTAADTLAFLDKFTGRKPYVKIGMELFYAEGPEIVREIKNRGHKIFLDLKLHDIPNTVEKAMKSLSKLSIDMVNVHAAGTVEMMEAAKRGLKGDSEEGPLLIDGKLEDVVIKYAQNAKKAGLDGVVCSPLESGMIHDACGDDFVTVTPGVRFADSAKDDQVRITTPEGAKKLGSDYIVVGRPITKAEDPVGAYERCLAEFTGEEK